MISKICRLHYNILRRYQPIFMYFKAVSYYNIIMGNYPYTDIPILTELIQIIILGNFK